MDRVQRQIVEKIKTAKRIQIWTNDGDLSLEFNCNASNAKKLFHDVGIAVQDYFVRNTDNRNHQTGLKG